jgi:O-antigen/teichoic acid export membrane protein
VVVLVAAGQCLVAVTLTLWQVRGMPVRYGAFQVLQTLTNVALTLALVVVLKRGWAGRVEAQALSVTAFALAAVAILRKEGWLRFSWNSGDVRHALGFGVPLIPHALGAMLITQTDRVFITTMVGVGETGVYMVGFQAAMVLELLAASFNQAYVPWLFARLKENDPAQKRRIVGFTYLCFAGILVLALALALFLPWFLSFFVGRDFTGAGRYTAWIVLGFAFNGMYYLVANYIFFAGATHVLGWITLTTALTNVLLNYLLITANGALGAAQASAAAFFMSFALTWALSAKVFPMPWNLRRSSR